MEKYKNFIKDISISIFIFLIAIFNMGFANHGISKKIREGNESFHKEQYDDALNHYNDAQLEAPALPEIYFNMGDALYQMKKYDEAVDAFNKSIERSDGTIDSAAYYNIGNAQFRQGRLQEALESYKQSLKINPDDADTKYNIEYTEKKIKEMLSKAQETKQKSMQEQADKKKQKDSNQQQGSEKQDKEEKKTESQQQNNGSESQDKDKMKEAAEKSDAKQNSEEKKSQMSDENNDKKQKYEANKSLDEKNEDVEKGDLKKDQAERFLSAYEKAQKQVMPQQQNAQQRSRYVAGKDW
ncbi:MAG: tetratricopeptide repeat protein [Chlamydiota bacterium]|nr:tetratricopeptide repeat protein [Chlamydiota bacterium]